MKTSQTNAETKAGKLIRRHDQLKVSVSEAKDVAKSHQLAIAKQTLSYSDAGAFVMGGMNKKEAIECLKKNGYNDKKITKLLKDHDYTDDEIKKLLSGK